MDGPCVEQIRGLCRALFIYLKSEGFHFPKDVEDSLALASAKKLGDHIKRHSINQRNFDSFKVVGFLAYEILTEVSAKTKGEELIISDPLRICALRCVDRLARHLKLETSQGTDIKKSDQAYIANLLYYEVTEDTHVGVGANGLVAIFSLLRKYGKDRADLKSV